MSKNHLYRELAPITEAGWTEIEKEAKRTLRGLLAARRVVDFRGPVGWQSSDVELGRVDPITAPAQSRGRLFFQPPGPGFARVTVIDGTGAADSVMVRLDDGAAAAPAAGGVRAACASGACARP